MNMLIRALSRIACSGSEHGHSSHPRRDGVRVFHIQLPEVVQFRGPPDRAVHQSQPAGLLGIPAFGLRGAGYFLGTSGIGVRLADLAGLLEPEDLAGIIGALGSIVTYLGTASIIPFLPNAWAAEAGGFPAMGLPVAFLMKDFLFLAARLSAQAGPDPHGAGDRAALNWRIR